MDKDQPAAAIGLMKDVVHGATATPEFYARLLSIFAALALALALVGTYGVIAYSVAQRSHEIGLRMALGARGSQVVSMVLLRTGRLALAGVVIGGSTAWAATGFLQTLLFEITPTDAATFAAVTLAIFTAAMLAGTIPARRATRVDYSAPRRCATNKSGGASPRRTPIAVARGGPMPRSAPAARADARAALTEKVTRSESGRLRPAGPPIAVARGGPMPRSAPAARADARAALTEKVTRNPVGLWLDLIAPRSLSASEDPNPSAGGACSDLSSPSSASARAEPSGSSATPIRFLSASMLWISNAPVVPTATWLDQFRARSAGQRSTRAPALRCLARARRTPRTPRGGSPARCAPDRLRRSTEPATTDPRRAASRRARSSACRRRPAAP